MRDEYSVVELCRVLGVSRSGYYAYRKRSPSPRALENQHLLRDIKDIHNHRHTRCYGSPRMTHQLRHAGHSCSVNRVARIMRRAGISARPRKAFRPRTTTPDHSACASPNRLAKAGNPETPGAQVVSDITYIPTAQGWLYLAVVIDLFSRSIIGWRLSDSLHAQIVTEAIEEADRSGLLGPGTIFHSDRGCQYSATLTRSKLAQRQWIQSMSAKGYCYDNAFAESTFASLKNELLPNRQIFKSKAQARNAVFDYIETFYNRKRLHSSLGYKSPVTFLNEHFQMSDQSVN